MTQEYDREITRLSEQVECLKTQLGSHKDRNDEGVAHLAQLTDNHFEAMDKALLIALGDIQTRTQSDLKHLDEIVLARFTSMDKALLIALSEVERRLEILNHAHERATEVQNIYVPRELQDKRNEQIDERMGVFQLALKECLPHIDFQQHLQHLIEERKEIAAWRLAMEVRLSDTIGKADLSASVERGRVEIALQVNSVTSRQDAMQKSVNDLGTAVITLRSTLAGQDTGQADAIEIAERAKRNLYAAAGAVTAVLSIVIAVVFGLR